MAVPPQSAVEVEFADLIRPTPPLEAYADEPAINGHAREVIRNDSVAANTGSNESPGVAHPAKNTRELYSLIDASSLLEPGPAPEFIVDGLFETQSVVGIVAPPESGKSLIMQEIAVCVALGRPFHGRRTRRGLVVYLVGEGQHGLRARFQALDTRYQLEGETFPLVISKIAAPLLDPLSFLRVQVAISEQEKRWEMPLGLLITDTLSRFISPGDESKSQDMGAYLNAVDQLRGDAAAVILHHPGHGDATRGRGSSSWKAGLDAEFSLANEAGAITVTCQKMKDGEKPAPFSFKIIVVDTKMARDDGSVITSALLEATETHMVHTPARGKNQKLLLACLEQQPKEPGVWTEGELRDFAKGLGMHRARAREAILGLRQMGYLVQTVGGSRLAV